MERYSDDDINVRDTFIFFLVMAGVQPHVDFAQQEHVPRRQVGPDARRPAARRPGPHLQRLRRKRLPPGAVVLFCLFVFFVFFSFSETAVFLFVSSFRAPVFLIVCTNEFMHPLIL